jgi:hypothetical protein
MPRWPVDARGLAQTPFPIADQMLELIVDLVRRELVIDSSEGWTGAILRYATLGDSTRRAEMLLDPLCSVHSHAVNLLQ